MISNNAVILISQISDERTPGKSLEEAAVAAATSRMRPFLPTALSSVLGMLPMAPTLFWGPMAFAIIGGHAVAAADALCDAAPQRPCEVGAFAGLTHHAGALSVAIRQAVGLQ
jgi:hypothetical protein